MKKAKWSKMLQWTFSKKKHKKKNKQTSANTATNRNSTTTTTRAATGPRDKCVVCPMYLLMPCNWLLTKFPCIPNKQRSAIPKSKFLWKVQKTQKTEKLLKKKATPVIRDNTAKETATIARGREIVNSCCCLASDSSSAATCTCPTQNNNNANKSNNNKRQQQQASNNN